MSYEDVQLSCRVVARAGLTLVSQTPKLVSSVRSRYQVLPLVQPKVKLSLRVVSEAF